MVETTAELVLDVGDRLVRLVTSETPVVVSNTVPKERRALQALLIKAVSIMRSLLDLARQDHNPEAMILARSLADHVITFAWLAIDPAVHYPRWERGDARDRLNAHERFQKRGRSLLEPGTKQLFERQNTNKVKYPPDMAGRADKADDYWATRLGFPPGDKPFADTYDVIFKHCSSRTHASVQGPQRRDRARAGAHRALPRSWPRVLGWCARRFAGDLRPRSEGGRRDIHDPSSRQGRAARV